MLQFILPFSIAFIVSLVATPLIARLAFLIGAVDKPNARKVHNSYMPRLGGLAIFAGFCTATVTLVGQDPKIAGLLFGSTVVLLFGIADDIRGISPWMKLLGQFMAALIVIYFGIKIDYVNNPLNGFFQLGALGIPLTIFWIMGITNAVNLIDGLDGLASGISAIALLTFAVIAYQSNLNTAAQLSLILVGAILGFLRYNFYPAKIFLGDSGSMFLGFIISGISAYGIVNGAPPYAFIISILALGVPILDTFLAIIRRYHDKRPIFQADKEHIHHRLLSRGLTHRQAVLVIYGISLCLSASALWVWSIL
ncbi:MAG: undecaprenyl/decaprenyl-phosphate alpha-N-acetylglucosaminyl 1-phosphate transferase [Firmicutes bacterium]|mgnify:CR=1 FL=1|nr:undecaprenyl/decaprenyl-phosphate alpha-N-acetylglucosaminyl 1-phosphate transferase [Bacillota bacterium]